MVPDRGSIHAMPAARGGWQPSVSARTQPKDEPGNRARRRRLGAAPHDTDDPAAVTGGFPERPGVVPADKIAVRVVQVGLGRDEHPFLVAALIDLDPLAGEHPFQ